MHVDRRLLGWGLFFILVGGIPLATHAGLLDQQVVSQWPLLWPVLLIAWGVGLLVRRTPIEWLGGALAAITFGVMGGGALAAGFGGIPIASGCGSGTATTAFATQTGAFTGPARADIEFNCGTLAVTTASGTAWTVAGADHKGQGPTVNAGPSNLTIRPQTQTAVFDPSGRSTWNVTLPRDEQLDLGVTLNAGEGTLDLTGATISSASLTLNAGDLTVDLGHAAVAGDLNMTVNAGSATVSLPTGDRTANLSLNAGSLHVCVPAASSLRVAWSSALGSNNFSSAGLVKVSEDTWTSPGFNPLQGHIELHVSANAGSFELEFGGSCGA
jgi:hypothetical protein